MTKVVIVGDTYSWKRQLERKRSWKVLSWKIRHKIGEIEVGKFGLKLEGRSEVGKFGLKFERTTEVGK